MANFPEQQKKSKSSTYPAPLIIPSLRDHRQTFIILHGRGSNASQFGPSLLDANLPSSQNFRAAFPHTKFVFSTASKRRAIIYNRSVINQWFDNWSLQTPTEREDLQTDGLRETSLLIHGLLASEVHLVGASNVVLGGLSQGCAAALIALLTWNAQPLGAVFGMCGWLPFRQQMEEIARAREADGDDIFEREGGVGQEVRDLPAQAVGVLREELEMAGEAGEAGMGTPVFLSHGVVDEKVPVALGREARSCLEGLGVAVEWREYDGLGHWCSQDMLGDVVDFLRRSVGGETVDADEGRA